MIHYTTNEFFSKGLQDLNLSLDLASQQKLLEFLHFLLKWNQHYNLTAVTALPKMISYHLLDSLAISHFIVGKRILDFGAGAGFPGIPLSIYFPEKHWTLLDSNGKKTRFLMQAMLEFQLKNVQIVHERAEFWAPTEKFDTIVTRAVGKMSETINQTQHLLKSNGSWLFMKSEAYEQELTGLKQSPIVHRLNVPGIPTPRYVVIYASDPLP